MTNASDFIIKIAIPCGSGEVTSLVEEAIAQGHVPPPTVLGLDIAAGMVKLYQARVDEKSWSPVSSKVQDAQDLTGISGDQFDLVFMNFGLMYMPDGGRCTKEVHRVLKPGGCAVFTT